MNDGDNAVRLQKFFMDFIDKAGEAKQYVVESRDGEGLREVELPFHLNRFDADEITVRLFSKLESFEEITDFEFFKYLILGDKYEGEDRDEFERKKNDSPLYRNLAKDYFKQANDTDQDFPDMNYSDITEKDMFGYPAISAANLSSDEGGIWAWHGFRKFEIKIRGFEDDNSSDLEQKINLYWNQIDSSEIDPIFEERIISFKKDFLSKDKKYIAYIDTNNLGEAITDDVESKHPMFAGRFEIHNIYTDIKMVYTFPIVLCVHDTRLKKGKNDLLDVNAVSIDFGTSSTCAAIRSKGKNRLLTLSGIHKRVNNDDNAYENPTNLMIYRWDEIYDQWRKENENCPFFLTTRREIDPSDHDYNEKEAQYDSGYTVGYQLSEMEADKIARNKMQAILTQLKSVPQLIKEGKEIKFTPFKGRNRMPVIVTDSIDENTIKKFNPVAFYGYLLSRAINNPANNRFYRTYQITYPVKFDKDVRENIRRSLEYGIKRALPASIREALDRNKKPIVNVSMNYPESIACVGSIVGRQLTITDDDQRAKLFAVYDLGGGTVDFAYGMFRPSLDDDEFDVADQFIEIFGVEGETNAGGEILIHRLAYKIYLDNRELMESERIKFVIPPEELNPEGFEGLLSPRGDYISDANVNILKEILARPLFVYPDEIGAHLTDIFPKGVEVTGYAPDAESFILPLLIDEDGNSKENFTVEVTGVDEFLEEKLAVTVNAFKDRMEKIFADNIEHMRAAGINDFNIDDVYIFLGGNASKQHYVRETMERLFPANNERGHIQRIGEGSEVEGESNEYRINEKTAVAFGQLNIGSYGYTARMTITDDESEDGTPPFLYNVGYIDPGSGKFVLVIGKGSKREWKKANRILASELTTNLYYTDNMTCDEKTLRPLAEDISEFVDEGARGKRTLFIRINKENSIEFRIGGVKDMPDEDEELDEDMVLQLK